MQYFLSIENTQDTLPFLYSCIIKTFYLINQNEKQFAWNICECLQNADIGMVKIVYNTIRIERNEMFVN